MSPKIEPRPLPSLVLLETSLKSFSAMSAHARLISDEASEIARGLVDEGAAGVGKMLSADSLETASAAGSDYARSAYACWVASARRMTDLYANMARDASRPFESMPAQSR